MGIGYSAEAIEDFVLRGDAASRPAAAAIRRNPRATPPLRKRLLRLGIDSNSPSALLFFPKPAFQNFD